MPKIILSENTVVGGTPISSAKYRAYFKNVIDRFSPEVYCGEFQYWLDSYTGKSLGDAIRDYYEYQESKSMNERLTEHRFSIISEADKTFISTFDDEINQLGYKSGDYIGWGACWGRYMIIYSKGGMKGKPVAARIFIRENEIVLRMFFNNIDKHIAYIEKSPPHIKDVFTGKHGNCNCNPKKENCKFRKSYTVDGQLTQKCSGVVFEFWQPDLEKLPDYIGLLKEFYPMKQVK